MSAIVLYRNGFDQVDATTEKGTKPKKDEKKTGRSLDTKGTFGPILSTVIVDAAQSELKWSRWEQGVNGMRAVFHYAVPEAKSHYEVTYCCLEQGDGTTVFRRRPGYHGEIAVDPVTGAILRLSVIADLDAKLPLIVSGIVVEYGPKEIAGATYICPVRSITLSRGRQRQTVHEWGGSFRTYGPYEAMLDDVTFSDYHMFRGETRVLRGFDPADDK
jgi:hypothetical protein